MSTFEEIEFDDDEVEEKEADKKKRPDDLFSVMGGVFSWANLKLIAFLFLIFIFLCSDLFAEYVLNKFDGTTDGRVPTNKGTIIQGIFLVLFYVIIDILIKYGLV